MDCFKNSVFNTSLPSGQFLLNKKTQNLKVSKIFLCFSKKFKSRSRLSKLRKRVMLNYHTRIYNKKIKIEFFLKIQRVRDQGNFLKFVFLKTRHSFFSDFQLFSVIS